MADHKDSNKDSLKIEKKESRSSHQGSLAKTDSDKLPKAHKDLTPVHKSESAPEVPAAATAKNDEEPKKKRDIALSILMAPIDLTVAGAKGVGSAIQTVGEATVSGTVTVANATGDAASKVGTTLATPVMFIGDKIAAIPKDESSSNKDALTSPRSSNAKSGSKKDDDVLLSPRTRQQRQHMIDKVEGEMKRKLEEQKTGVVSPRSSVSGSTLNSSTSTAGGSHVQPLERKESLEIDPFLEECDVTLDPISDLDALQFFPDTLSAPIGAARTVVKKVAVVFNPHSGAKKGLKLMEAAAKHFADLKVECQAVPTEHRGHAEELAEKFDVTGIDVLVFLGGDGTFHEACNGWMRRKPEDRRRVPVALIAGGTGNSFALELYGDVKVRRAVRHIARGVSAPMDLARITIPHPDKGDEVVWSFNSIHWGLASKVNVTAERLRWMGKALRYTTAALMEMLHGEKMRASIMCEDKDGVVSKIEDDFCLIIANNIRGAAKGMKMAPNAKINDGLIDLILIKSQKMIDLAHVFKRMYEGTHVNLPFVDYRQVRKFSITPFVSDKSSKKEVVAQEADPEIAEELVDVDGELKGSTPFLCEMAPHAIRVIV